MVIVHRFSRMMPWHLAQAHFWGTWRTSHPQKFYGPRTKQAMTLWWALGVRWSSSPAKPPGFFPECIQHPIVGIEDTHTMIWNLEIPRKCRHIQQTMWGFNIPPVPQTTTKSKMTWSALFLSIKPINCWSRSTDGDSIPNKKWQNTLIPCENSFCVNCDLVNYT